MKSQAFMYTHCKKLKWLALTFGAAFLAGTALADDKALLDALVKKGVLTDQEAQQNEADVATSGSKFLNKLSLSGRIQSQFVDLSTDISGAAKVPATQHFLLRRVYFGVKADLGAGFSGTINY